MPKLNPDTPLYLSPQQVAQLLKAAKGSKRDFSMILLAYQHGLRASEVGAQRIEGLDLTSKQPTWMVLRLKGSVGGKYPLSPEAVKALKAWLKVRGGAQGAIWVSRAGGPISRQQLDTLIKEYGREAGFKWPLRWHLLRHSCGQALIARGVPIRQVQDWLGHKAIGSTMRYAHVSEETRKGTAQALWEPQEAPKANWKADASPGEETQPPVW